MKLKLKVIIAGRGEYLINGYQLHIRGVTVFTIDSQGLPMDDWYIKDLDLVEFFQDINNDGDYKKVEL